MASLSDNFKIDSTELSLNLAAQFEDSAARKAGHRVVQLHGVPAFVVQSLRAATCPHHQVCAQTSQSRLFSPSNSRLLVPQLPLLEQPHLLSLLHLQQLEQQSFAVQGANLTRNLIPLHPKASDVSASLLATRIRQSAIATPALLAPLLTGITQAARAAPTILRPALTVQDLPMAPPFYNGVNPNYPGLHVLNNSPPIFAVDNFLTPYECDFLINAAVDALGPAPVVGKGAGEISPSRTSSTCYLAREDLGDLMRKVSLLTGKPAEHCELPQVGRYFYQEKYLQHFDAFDLGTDDGRRFAANGGQRTVTVLIYLNDVMRGGATRFPALNLDVQPRRGMALVFFPATVDGMLDKMALHAALPAIDTKFVSQVWIRQFTYNGQPSKRLQETLGPPISLQTNPPATQHNYPVHSSTTANMFWQQTQSTMPMYL